MPLSVYVGFPNIAQDELNQSSLELVSEEVTNPRPDAVSLKIQNVAKSDSMFTPTMDAFQAALFLEDTEPNIKPFGYITIPSLHVQKENPVMIDQELRIIDQEQFARYTTLVMQSETYRLAVRGQTDLHLGALPTTKVNFNKVMTSQGKHCALAMSESSLCSRRSQQVARLSCGGL